MYYEGLHADIETPVAKHIPGSSLLEVILRSGISFTVCQVPSQNQFGLQELDVKKKLLRCVRQSKFSVKLTRL